MLTRRMVLQKTWLLTTSLLCLSFLCLSGLVATALKSQAGALESQAGVPQGPLLEKRLMVGLRVKTAPDRAFIKKVVLLVEKNVLPVSLVDSTFFWARERAERPGALKNNPMVYFRRALVVRAKDLGISL